MHFMIWRACERFGMLPPLFYTRRWDKLNNIQRADLIAYAQIREHEENAELKIMAGVK